MRSIVWRELEPSNVAASGVPYRDNADVIATMRALSAAGASVGNFGYPRTFGRWMNSHGEGHGPTGTSITDG